jgi:hypothetical protein
MAQLWVLCTKGQGTWAGVQCVMPVVQSSFAPDLACDGKIESSVCVLSRQINHLMRTLSMRDSISARAE